MDISSIMATLKTTMDGYYTSLVEKVTAVKTALNTHASDTNNPHNVNKRDVELDRVANYPPATKQQAQDGLNNTSYLTPLRGRETIQPVVDDLEQAFADATNDLQ